MPEGNFQNPSVQPSTESRIKALEEMLGRAKTPDAKAVIQQRIENLKASSNNTNS